MYGLLGMCEKNVFFFPCKPRALVQKIWPRISEPRVFRRNTMLREGTHGFAEYLGKQQVWFSSLLISFQGFWLRGYNSDSRV